MSHGNVDDSLVPGWVRVMAQPLATAMRCDGPAGPHQDPLADLHPGQDVELLLSNSTTLSRHGQKHGRCTQTSTTANNSMLHAGRDGLGSDISHPFGRVRMRLWVRRGADRLWNRVRRNRHRSRRLCFGSCARADESVSAAVRRRAQSAAGVDRWQPLVSGKHGHLLSQLGACAYMQNETRVQTAVRQDTNMDADWMLIVMLTDGAGR